MTHHEIYKNIVCIPPSNQEKSAVLFTRTKTYAHKMLKIFHSGYSDFAVFVIFQTNSKRHIYFEKVFQIFTLNLNDVPLFSTEFLYFLQLFRFKSAPK